MLNIYTPELKRVGVISDYDSLIFNSKFYESGEFEMYININKKYTEELKLFNIIQVDSKQDKAGIILHRSLPLNDSGHSGETLFIKGRTLDGITKHFNIIPSSDESFMSIKGSQEYIMKEFVKQNMIEPLDPSRKVENLHLAEYKNLGVLDSWRGRFEKVSDKLEEIGIYADLGWNILFDSKKKKLIFDIKRGTDRKVGNNVNAPVIFEMGFGNILAREYTEDLMNSANVVYAGGSGELQDKLIQKVGDNKGIRRIETYQDFSNIDSSTELKIMAEQQLKELAMVETFNVNASPGGSFVYEKDYFLGDYVTVIDRELGIKMDTQITSIKEIDRYNIEIQFGKKVPDLISKFKKREVVK